MILNIFNAICSLVIPGMGQFLQGRCCVGFGHLCVSLFLWQIFLGWLIHFYSAADAASYNEHPYVVWRE